MAIVKTTFDSGSSNLSQVKDWLDSNKNGYFDEVTLENSVITCTKDGHTAFVITNTENRYKVYVANGSYVTIKSKVTYYGISTSKSLLLHSVDPNYSSNNNDIIITKTNEGGLGFVVIGTVHNGDYDYQQYYVLDFNKTLSLNYRYQGGYIHAVTNSVFSFLSPFTNENVTSIANVVCKNTDSYTPDVYQIVYSQYSYDTTGIISLGGKDYFTNGCFLLAD